MSKAILKLSPLEALYRERKKKPGPKVRPLSERFWAKVNKDGPVRISGLGPCWTWTARRLPSGYGQIYAEGVGPQSSHRLSWMFANGEIPAGMCVCHRCDNPPCVNPDHLFLGTDADNARDRDTKGRLVVGRRMRGEESHLARLSQFSVTQIRNMRRRGVPATRIADIFGVTAANVRHIVARRTWRHVP